MGTENAILSAKTINDLMIALSNGFKLPTEADFPPQSELKKIWGMGISVSKEPEGYCAKTTDDYPISAGLAGKFYVHITNEQTTD